MKTMRQMAARGANKIGKWARTRIPAPHMPKGTIDFWIDESINEGDKVKTDMTNVIRKFKREHLSPVEFFSFLKKGMRKHGWQFIDTRDMPGPGFVPLDASKRFRDVPDSVFWNIMFNSSDVPFSTPS